MPLGRIRGAVWLALMLAASQTAYAVTSSPSATVDPLVKPEPSIEDLTTDIVSGKLTSKELADTYFKRAIAKSRQLKDAQGSIDDCSQAIQIMDSAPPHLLRGTLYVAQTKYSNALEDYAAASRLDPKNVEAHALSAGLQWGLKNVDQFAVEMDAAIALLPDPLDALKKRAELYFNNGYWARALPDYNAILQRDTANAEIFRYRGDAKSYLGDYDGGMRDYDQAVKLDPKTETAPVAFSKTMSYFDRQNYRDAETQAQTAVEAAPDNAYYLLWLHTIRLHGGKTDDPDFVARSATVDHASWPWTIVAYHLGRSSDDDAWAAADKGPNPETTNNQKCEAAFYLGEGYFNRDKARAKELFKQASERCLKGFIEYNGAVFELRGMGETLAF